jgi:hypothetical protein
MRRSLLVPLSLLALAGCATGPSLRTRMAAYIGANEQTLVQQLGVPDKQITVSGVQYVAYEQSYQQITGGPYYGGWYGPYGSPFYGGFYPPFYQASFPAQIVTYGCEITFMLKDGRVFNFSLRGNDC